MIDIFTDNSEIARGRLPPGLPEAMGEIKGSFTRCENL
jgi:hypothetical protein